MADDLPPGGQPFSVPQPFPVILDDNGYGYAVITVPSGVLWRVILATVSTSETRLTVNPPIVRIYKGTTPSPAHFLELTYSGNGAPSDTRHVLLGGESLTAEWTGGTPGSSAVFRLTGMQYRA